MPTGTQWTFVAVAVSGLALMTVPANAETMVFKTVLSGENESPPNMSDARAEAEMSFDTETRELKWTVRTENLSGPVTGAHIHGPADPGANAGIVVGLANPNDNPLNGSATLSEEQADNLLAVKLYFNFHTERHPGGEVRGQIEPGKMD